MLERGRETIERLQRKKKAREKKHKKTENKTDETEVILLSNSFMLLKGPSREKSEENKKRFYFPVD